MDLSVSEKYKSNYPIKVDNQSTEEMHKEVYKIAKYFKEELNYDIVPYCPYGDLREKYNALLFTEKAYDIFENEPIPYLIFGACNFTIQKFTESDDYWKLEWIWFHPFFRNRGNLKANWNYLEKEFGNFLIGTPISNDMKMFLKNIDSIYEHIEI